MKKVYDVTIKYRGYFAGRNPNGSYDLRGRGRRETITHAELLGILNTRPKKGR